MEVVCRPLASNSPFNFRCEARGARGWRCRAAAREPLSTFELQHGHEHGRSHGRRHAVGRVDADGQAAAHPHDVADGDEQRSASTGPNSAAFDAAASSATHPRPRQRAGRPRRRRRRTRAQRRVERIAAVVVERGANEAAHAHKAAVAEAVMQRPAPRRRRCRVSKHVPATYAYTTPRRRRRHTRTRRRRRRARLGPRRATAAFTSGANAPRPSWRTQKPTTNSWRASSCTAGSKQAHGTPQPAQLRRRCSKTPTQGRTSECGKLGAAMEMPIQSRYAPACAM